jgi:hypothetical protein
MGSGRKFDIQPACARQMIGNNGSRYQWATENQHHKKIAQEDD